MRAAWMGLGLQVLAFWPVWRWHALRSSDASEEGWGLAALLGAMWVIGREVRERHLSHAGQEGAADAWPLRLGPSRGAGMGWGAAATCLYAAAFPWLSPLPRALLAVLALGCMLPALGLRTGACLQASAFLFLSLPVMASLQFYLGYPLRAVCGIAACKLINLSGYPAILDGILITWKEHVLLIDAPCSGVKMLWAGLFLGTALAAHGGLGPRATTGLLAGSLAAVLAGNVLRTTALFYLETGVVHGPAWAHGAIGVAAFLAAAGLLIALLARLKNPSPGEIPSGRGLKEVLCAS